jgi:hypothetical protein
MTNPGGTAAPGWYPDPRGSGALRWWTGTGWSEHLAAPPNPYGPVQRRTLAAGTPVYTVWIWLVVFLPLVSALSFLFLHPQLPAFTELESGRIGVSDPFALLGGPVYFVVVSLGWLLSAVMIVSSWLDYRELTRRGVERPFHWAWSFLGIVYPIGRSVIVRKVAGRGIAPMWCAIGVELAAIVIATVWSIVLVSEILGTVAQNVPYGS